MLQKMLQPNGGGNIISSSDIVLPKIIYKAGEINVGFAKTGSGGLSDTEDYLNWSISTSSSSYLEGRFICKIPFDLTDYRVIRVYGQWYCGEGGYNNGRIGITSDPYAAPSITIQSWDNNSSAQRGTHDFDVSLDITEQTGLWYFGGYIRGKGGNFATNGWMHMNEIYVQ